MIIQVVVLDGNLAYVPNVTVTFTAQSGHNGASGTFANGTNTTTATTGATGLATASVLTANHAAGQFSVSVTAGTASTLIAEHNLAVDTTTAVTSSTGGTSVVGQPVTFTATVTPANVTGQPTGTIVFKDGGTIIPGCASAALSAKKATCGPVTPSLGGHSITAEYSGDAGFNPSTAPGFTQTVNRAGTTTTLGSSPNPSDYQQSVTFTATVAVQAPGAGSPTGTVDFKEGGTVLGSGTVGANGQATFSTAALAPTGHSITASYTGDTNFTGSTSSPFTQNVNKVTTGTTLGSSPNPSTYQQSVTFTATVSCPGFTPTGTVDFKEGGTVLGSGTVGANGQATFSTTSLGVATHAVTAAYGSDNICAPSTSLSLNQVVNPPDTTPPVTTATPTGTTGTNGWFKSAVAVALSATDNAGGSGVAKTEYKLDGAGWMAYTAGTPVAISGDGAHTLLYRSTDVAGNQEGDETLTIKIDATKPTSVTGTPDRAANGAGWYNARGDGDFRGQDAVGASPAARRRATAARTVRRHRWRAVAPTTRATRERLLRPQVRRDQAGDDGDANGDGGDERLVQERRRGHAERRGQCDATRAWRRRSPTWMARAGWRTRPARRWRSRGTGRTRCSTARPTWRGTWRRTRR